MRRGGLLNLRPWLGAAGEACYGVARHGEARLAVARLGAAGKAGQGQVR